MKRIVLCAHLLVVVAMVLAACGPTAEPVVVKETVQVVETVKETVQVEVPVKETVQVEVPVKETVQVVVTATPVPPPEPKAGGILIAAYATDAKGVDPHKATNFSAFRIVELTYDTLLRFDKDLKVIPNLAESWEWSADNLTLTMKLHQGVKFHSGNPLTSADVKFSIERILDEATGAAARSYFTVIASIETPDDNTVVFKLSEPAVSLLAAMTGANSSVVDKVAIEGGADPAQTEVGSGPFKLVSWEPDHKLVLAKNEGYWVEGVPYLDGIEFRTIPDESSILAALRTKQVDWAVIADPKVAIAAGSASSNLVIDRATALSYHVMQLNPERDVFKDVRVRQALSCAIDRQQVLDVASMGEGRIVGPVTAPYYQTPLDELFCYTPDLEKAKQLLADAGVTNLKFGMLATMEEMPVTVAEAQNIQAQLTALGIETEIEIVELGVFVDRWFATDFDGVLTENGGNPDPDVMLYRYWHSTGNLQSVAKYTAPDLDQWLTQARTIAAPEDRKPIYNEIDKFLVEQSPWIWLYVGYQYRVMQPDVMGYTGLSTGSAVYLRETWLNR